MPCWTAINHAGDFTNLWSTPNGIAMRSHNGPRILQTNWATPDKALHYHIGAAHHPFNVREAALPAGEFYPRICREFIGSPNQELPDPGKHYHFEMAASLQSARNLFAQLREVFRFVEPSDKNRAVYGDQLRSLLILASTEVESAWRSVLVANNGAAPGDRLSTKDYVRLMEPMRLDEWRIVLPGFPDYDEIIPFQNWDSNAPTASLGWYDAYNKTKHDREGGLGFATLESMLAAMAGVYALLAAQFGVGRLHGPNPISTDLIATTIPRWTACEFYVPPLVDGGNGSWTARKAF